MYITVMSKTKTNFYTFHFIVNNFSPNVLSVIEQLMQYQQKICLPEEGIRVLKIDVS